MSALLYWTCGKEMADMLLANGDAKEAEKLIRSQIADFKYKFSKNQDVWLAQANEPPSPRIYSGVVD